jgi:single-stranded-DNA-specific exonuclease
VAAHHPELISRFGGHAMAAGLSLPQENFSTFARAFDEEVRQYLDEDQLHGVLLSDGPLTVEEMDLELAELIRASGPWGQGFEEPLFHGEFEILERRIVGEHHLKLSLRPPDSSRVLDAIAFHTTDADWPAGTTYVEAAYRLDVNEFRGLRSVQLILQYVRPLSPAG